MDFYQIKEHYPKKGIIEIYPDFKVCRSKDLMVRGRSFYAVWDEEAGLWSTDEYDVQRLVDKDLIAYKERIKNRTDCIINVKLMSDFSSGSWVSFKKYLLNVSDNSHQLDEKLTFSNTEVKKKDYVSKRLSYPLQSGSIDSYDQIIGKLYEPSERAKLEWAIGAVLSGDSKKIQKFIVLYGEAGAGKSTILNIIQKLFHGYYTTFDAKALTSTSNSFSTEVFKHNPLVAIQHDGDLSKIEDNTKLNSIVSHEEMTLNEKYKSSYTSKINAFLFMATNKPVKITDAKSGIIRRLIDVKPSGNRIPPKIYQALINQIDFELGAIAYHCLDVYYEMGPNYYNDYKPIDMMLQTDVFFNFVESCYFVFKEQDGVTLSQAYEMYKEYCDDTMVEFKLPRYKFREELKNYFKEFSELTRLDGRQIRSYYSGFLFDKINSFEEPKQEDKREKLLVLEETTSILDDELSNCQAQLAKDDSPQYKWINVRTKLKDIDTTKVHYVKPPENHIVIDFDLKDEQGNKSIIKNIEEASKWPSTYTEFSKSGCGIHLHYIYDGDVTKLSRIYSPNIEILTFTGNSSLRRKLTKCNNIPIKTLNSGLPLKGEKMVNFESIASEGALRTIILKNLNKEYHNNTTQSVHFINQALDDAYKSGINYDVTDLRPRILAFANNSTNQSKHCVNLVSKMKFKSANNESEQKKYSETIKQESYLDDDLVFFDVEVFPNLFIVGWKVEGKPTIKMINPTPKDIEPLLSRKLVGFNCRRYDNHILYARYIGYNNSELFALSQRIINGSPNAFFSQAYSLSYTDIYEFSSEKKSLKKWEIDLGIFHKELNIPWDQEVPKERWLEVADYCSVDVDATEIVFKHLKQDWIARLILSELSGLTPNDTTQQHAARIIFGNDPNPQSKFIYTNLSNDFPGYTFENGKSLYRGEDPKEGGYVYAEPGMYNNVVLLDVESMHPTSAIVMNIFGPYTKNYEELKKARLAIKHGEYEKAATMLNGVLAKYLTSTDDSDDLSYALKIVINIVYGLTSANYDNPFRDPRNKDNIVAKRGALFMIDLKHEVQSRGFTVAHIKTDSIKIPNATPEIIQFVKDFGKKYGYNFDHEATFDRLCLLNDAVYIGKYKWHKKEKKIGKWDAVGTQTSYPYVFKTLFSKEPITFDDLCETKSVTTALYLDMNEDLEDDEHRYHFVGKVGRFTPMRPGSGGGILLREKDGKYHAATGSKGYRWMESWMVKELNKEGEIDNQYFIDKVNEMVDDISKFGDIEQFLK